MHKCREIVWATYPFTSHEKSKKRPVLISAINSHGDFICLPLTSSEVKYSFKLKSDDLDTKVDLKLIRIITTSCISFEHPMTLDKSHFQDKAITKLTELAYKSVMENFYKFNCN